MKRILIAFGTAAALALAVTPALAQGMMGGWNYAGSPTTIAAPVDATQTTQEEAEGKAIWLRLQSKQATCADLKNADFDVLGDYFMGLMMGGSHAAMNQQLEARFGEADATQMHIAMGKRLSGCDASAAFPASGSGYLSTMMGSSGRSMMGRASAYGDYAYGPTMMAGYDASPDMEIGYWVTLWLIWIFLGLGIYALAKWILKKK